MPGPMSARLTGEQYIAVLLQRQGEWIAEHPGYRWPPLLEWFVRDGDEHLVDLSGEDIPAEPEQFRGAAGALPVEFTGRDDQPVVDHKATEILFMEIDAGEAFSDPL